MVKDLEKQINTSSCHWETTSHRNIKVLRKLLNHQSIGGTASWNSHCVAIKRLELIEEGDGDGGEVTGPVAELRLA